MIGWPTASGRGLLARLESDDPARSLDLGTSISAHLRALLNTRLGHAPATPGFGLPDLSEFVHDFPDAVRGLARSIKETVARYEPRLHHVRVRRVPGLDPAGLLFEISGRLADDPRRPVLRIRAHVHRTGRVTIE